MAQKKRFQLPAGMDINVDKTTLLVVALGIGVFVLIGVAFPRSRPMSSLPEEKKEETAAPIMGVVAAIDKRAGTISFTVQANVLGFFKSEKTMVGRVVPETAFYREVVVTVASNPPQRTVVPLSFGDIKVGDSASVVAFRESGQAHEDDFTINSLMVGPTYFEYSEFSSEEERDRARPPGL